MTNREYMIGLLEDVFFIDDGGASYEAMVYYNINCPYRGSDERALCNDEDAYRKNKRRTCFMCKAIWLSNEVDI